VGSVLADGADGLSGELKEKVIRKVCERYGFVEGVAFGCENGAGE